MFCKYMPHSKVIFKSMTSADNTGQVDLHGLTDLSTSLCPLTLVMAAIYLMMILEASVFPDPLSPGKQI